LQQRAFPMRHTIPEVEQQHEDATAHETPDRPTE
jgi:hypothetical protein